MTRRSRAFIDKYSITIPIPEEHWIVAAENLHNLPFTNQNVSAPRFSNPGSRTQLYLASWTFRPSVGTTDSKFYFQAMPMRPNIAFIRIEWNPRKIDKEGVDEMITLLEQCIPTLRLALANAFVTRADITFDVETSIESFYLITHSAATSTQSWHENFGRLNAYYLGSSNAPHKYLCYDKNFQLFGGNKVIASNGTLRLLRNRTRCELRLSRVGTIQEIMHRPNPLLRYIFVDRMKTLSNSHVGSWNRLLDRQSRMIAQDVIKVFTTQAERAKLRRALIDCSPAWYNSEEIWREGCTALNEISRDWFH